MEPLMNQQRTPLLDAVYGSIELLLGYVSILLRLIEDLAAKVNRYELAIYLLTQRSANSLLRCVAQNLERLAEIRMVELLNAPDPIAFCSTAVQRHRTFCFVSLVRTSSSSARFGRNLCRNWIMPTNALMSALR